MNKYFEYFYEKLIISIKSFLEYKSDFYAIFLKEIFTFGITIIFYLVYIDLVGDFILNWDVYDLIFFYILTKFSLRLNNIFYFSNFSKELLKGNLNIHLFKPISTYFVYLTNNFKQGKVVVLFIYLIILVIVLFLYTLENYFLSFLFWIIGFMGSLFFSNTIEILGFFIKDSSSIKLMSKSVEEISQRFTYAAFENHIYFAKIIFVFLPQGVVCYLTYQILLGNLTYFYNYILVLISYLFILGVINLFIWRQGLKKYEAFG